MELRHISTTSSDVRGNITDLVENTQFNSATIINCRRGAVRGNHYHKETTQYLYLLSGSLLYRTRLPNGSIVDKALRSGDMMMTEPLEEHALQALEESSFLVLTRGPRQGSQYESDTFRLEAPLIPVS